MNTYIGILCSFFLEYITLISVRFNVILMNCPSLPRKNIALYTS